MLSRQPPSKPGAGTDTRAERIASATSTRSDASASPRTSPPQSRSWLQAMRPGSPDTPPSRRRALDWSPNPVRPNVRPSPLPGAGGGAQLADDLDQEVEVGGGGAPVADRGAEGGPAGVDGAAGEHPAVVKEGLGEVGGQVAVALDQRPVAVAAVGGQGGPDGQGAGPAGRLGAEEAVAAPGVVGAGEVGRPGHAERRAEPGGVADEGEAALIGDVEPLVGVGGDRVGPLHARGEVGGARGEGCEQPEGAVDVQPGAELRGQVGQVGQRVELARVGPAGGGDQNGGGAVELLQPPPGPPAGRRAAGASPG